MKKRLVIVGKVILFAAISLWILCFIGVTMALLPPLVDYLEDQKVEDGVIKGLVAWYLITFVLVAMWAAVKGFNSVGKWEPRKEKEDED